MGRSVCISSFNTNSYNVSIYKLKFCCSSTWQLFMICDTVFPFVCVFTGEMCTQNAQSWFMIQKREERKLQFSITKNLFFALFCTVSKNQQFFFLPHRDRKLTKQVSETTTPNLENLKPALYRLDLLISPSHLQYCGRLTSKNIKWTLD